MRTSLFIALLLCAAVVTFGGFLFLNGPQGAAMPSGIGALRTPASDTRQAYILPLAGPAYRPVRDTTVPDKKLEARAGVIYDVTADRMLFEQDVLVQMPIASLTKLMTAMVAWDRIGPDTIVSVASASLKVDGEKQTLYAGEQLRVRDLTALMLVESSNDAAYALAQHAASAGWSFVDAMNQRAQTLGMRDTVFRDPAGLDDSAVSTAQDVVRMVRATLAYDAFWPLMRQQQIVVRSVDGALAHTADSTNQLLGKVPEIIGGKTGYTDGALGCLILVVQRGPQRDTLISVVLGSRGRFSEMASLLEWFNRAYAW